MASFLADLAKKYVEKLIDGLISESRYICCYTCIVEDFEKEKKTLEAEKKTLEARVKVAKNQGSGDQANVTLWQEEANKIIQDQDSEASMTCFFGICPNCKQRYSRGKELTNKTKEIGRLLQTKFESVGLPLDLPGVEYYSSQSYISFESRKKKYEDLLDALSDDNNYMIGLQGMGGTGKTTLAKRVGTQLKQSKVFDFVIDTTVSNAPDIKKIQDDIAAPLGLKLKEYNESERHKMLWNRLTNGEKILVILDDVWWHINLEKIGVPCKDNHKGCKVLVTTRNLWACNSLGCEKIIQLELLSEEDAWNLFKKHAAITGAISKHLLEKGSEIVKECKGLPIAIAAIAGSLKGQQRKEEWDAALRCLKKPTPMQGVDENLVEVYRCLKYSYDNLKNGNDKELFLLCSLFPEDHEIPIETLIELSIAAGHLGEIEGKYDDYRSQVVVAKNRLLDSCLLLEAGDGKVKMHDLVRDVALWVANKRIQAINLSNKNHKSLVEKDNDIEYLLCEGKCEDVFCCKVNGSKLKLLLVNLDEDEYGGDEGNPLDIPNSFFENMTRLQAFKLSCPRGRTALSLPPSIQSLTNIRSLYVRCAALRDISILGSLRSLETLEFNCCSLLELPHEISELGNLRLLKFYLCEFGKKDPFKVIERCKSLEELYFIEYDYGSEPFIISSVFDENITLTTLQKYCICQSFHNYEHKYSSSISKYVDLVVEIDGFFSKATFRYLVKTAEILWLRRTKGAWRNLMPEIISIDQGMKDIVELILESCSQMNCLIDINAPLLTNVFPKLVALILERMENFEELCKGSIPFDLMMNLERLEIKECKQLQGMLFKSKMNLCNLKTIKLYMCPKLESLFQVSTSRSLVLLEKLDIEDCENLKNIIVTDEGQVEDERVDGENDNIKSCGSIMFPKLRTLGISKCPKLEFILPFLSYAQGLPFLEVVRIIKCGELKYIFGKHQHEVVKDVILGSLREISLKDSPNFINIFEECNDLWCSSSSRGDDSSKSKTQLKLEDSTPNKCKILFPWTNLSCCYDGTSRSSTTRTVTEITTAVSNSKNDQHQDYSTSLVSKNSMYVQLSRQWQMMHNAKKIEIYKVPKLKSLFTLSSATTMLLETLEVKYCDELKRIIAVDDNTGNEGSDDSSEWSNVFPKLKVLFVSNCVELEYVIGDLTPPHPHHNAHIQLPSLTLVKFINLPKLIGICSSTSYSYHITVPLLSKLDLFECPQYTIKELSGNMESLNVRKSTAESIVCVGDQQVIGQQMELRLKEIHLCDLSHMMHLFMGPQNSFITLHNLKELTIEGCEKLQVMFSASVARWLPQLESLIIRECKELKQIVVEEEEENQEIIIMSNSAETLFPKLRSVEVKECNKLKCVFPSVSTLKELPKLESLVIKEALELEQVFFRSEHKLVELPNLRCVEVQKCNKLKSVFPVISTSKGVPIQLKIVIIREAMELEQVFFRVDQKSVELPNLKAIVLVELPKLICPGIELQLQKTDPPTTTLFLHQCPKLICSTSFNLTTLDEFNQQLAEQVKRDSDWTSYNTLTNIVEELKNYKTQDTGNENSILEMAEEVQVGPEVGAESESESESTHGNGGDGLVPISSASPVMMTEDAHQECEMDGFSKAPVAKTVEDFRVGVEVQGKTIEKAPSLDIPLLETNLQGNKINIEEGTTSTNANKTITSSTHLELDRLPASPLVSSAHEAILKEDVGASHSQQTSKSVVAIAETYSSDIPLHKTDSHELLDEQPCLKNKPQTLGETSTTFDIPQEKKYLERPQDNSIEKGSKLEIRNMSPTPLPAPLQKDIQKNIEQVTTANAKIITSSTHLESLSSSASTLVSSKHETYPQKDGDGQIAAENPITTTKDVDVSHSPETSPQSSFGGYPSKGVADLSFASLVTKEMEELVSNKYLADENLSLLTDFLIKHPSVRLKNGSFSNRNKGYAYNCLAELLNFLQTHSVLDVLESSHSDFVELLQDVRKCGFDKDWLDDVEKRALFPGLQVSEEAMRKISDSKRILTQHVEDLKHQLESSEAVLESIIQQETQVLEATAALRSPIGY